MTRNRRTATEEIRGRIELLGKQVESWKQEAANCRRQAKEADESVAQGELLITEYSELISHQES